MNMMTFGLNQLSVKVPGTFAPAVGEAAVGYINPAILLLLTAIFWRLAKRPFLARYLSRLQRRKTLIHVLWLILGLSFTVLSMAMTRPLKCTMIEGTGPTIWWNSNNGVRCFKGAHICYATISAVATFTLGILPVFLIHTNCVQSMPCMKGLLDEATYIYKDNCRWWLSVNLARRTAVALVTLSPITAIREYSYVFLFFALLGLHVTYKWVINYTRPMQTSVRRCISASPSSVCVCLPVRISQPNSCKVEFWVCTGGRLQRL